MSRVRPRTDEVEDLEPQIARQRIETQTGVTEVTEATDTQTDLDLSRAFQEQVSFEEHETKTFFDLTPYTFSPCVLTQSDAEQLQKNLPLRPETAARIPAWACVDDVSFSYGEHSFVKEAVIAKNHNGFVINGSFDGRACVAKIMYLNNLVEIHPIVQEVLIQAILLEFTENNRKLPPDCTKIPRLEAFGSTTTYMRTAKEEDGSWIIKRQERVIPAAIIVMEKIEHDLYSYVRQPHIDTAMRSNICAAVFQQIAELLMFLGPLHFMHADLKMNNITFNLQEGRKIHPNTFIIDFGLASLDYNGVRIGAGAIFNSIRFKTPNFHNPYTDLVYLAWSMWRFHSCDIQVLVDCPAFTEIFSKIIQRVLQASGIPFGSDRRFDKISTDTFRAMLTAGLEHPTTYARSSLWSPIDITPEQIQHYALLYMKSVGSARHGKEAGDKLLRVLGRP